MRPLHLSLLARPRPVWVAWFVLAAATFVVADTTWRGGQLAQEAARLETASAAPPSPARRTAPNRLDPAAQRELRQAEQVAQRLALPWGELFRAIESASGTSVALLSIEPDAQSGEISITGEAVDQRAVIAYLGRLARLPRLHDVHLVRHESHTEESSRTLHFMISARWGPAR